MTKRIISFVIALVIICGMIPVTVSAAATYSVSKAMDYAKAHWNDGKGLCAEFVSRCVIAGGLNMSVEAGTGPCYRAIQTASGLTRQDLKLNSKGHATKDLNGTNLAAGDVVIQWCKTHSIAPHILFCAGYDSSGYALYYAHNGALNKARYNLSVNTAYDHTTACDMGGQVIRISTLDKGTGVKFEGTCSPYTNALYTGAALDYEVSFNGTLTSFEIYFGLSADNMVLDDSFSGSFKNSPYVVDWTLTYLEPNTTYYYQMCATVDGKVYKDTVRSFTTPAYNVQISVSGVTECGYSITFPAHKTVFCYNSPTSMDKYRQYTGTDSKIILFCTKRYAMSDGSVRYYLVDSNNNELYFRFTPDMSIQTVHNFTSTIEVPGTCTQPGYINRVCTCGATEVGDFIPAGHSWGVWQVSVQANATTPGLKYRVCKSCNKMETEVIPAGGQMTENPFIDISEGTYYYEPVIWAVQNGVTTGTGNGTTFSPDMICTRAQVVTFLWRALGSPEPKTAVNPFKDVASSAYYYKAVLWAVENGITTGTGNGTTFSPDMNCTRAQVVTFLWRGAGSPTSASTVNSFSDIQKGSYYYNAVLWAVGRGITTGTGSTTFSPDTACSRAQIVTFLMRYAGQ